MINKYDVIIIGAGPAGIASGIRLKLEKDLSVLIIDDGTEIKDRAGESAPPNILPSLRRLGLDKAFLAGRHEIFPGSVVQWGSPDMGYNDYLFNPTGPAWRLDRQSFDTMLQKAAANHNINILWNTKYVSHRPFDEKTRCHDISYLESGTGIIRSASASWIIDASGPKAIFARSKETKTVIHDHFFGLARVSQVSTGAISRQLFIESVENGWWYTAAIPGERIITIYAGEGNQMKSLHNDPAAFHEMTLKTSLTDKTLSGLSLVTEKFCLYPIYSSALSKITGENWLATGDAASCYDPIVSQGICKALQNGISAAEAIIGKFNDKADSLMDYETSVNNAYKQYLQERTLLYKREKRWVNQPFWYNRNNSGKSKI
jgi:flavin-dependent dehydrogenase